MTEDRTDAQVFEESSTIEGWDDDYYHPLALEFYDEAVADMLDAMEVPEGATVLDAGCGPGVHSIRAVGAGHRVHAFDLSGAMLDQARARVAAAGMSDRVAFGRGDLTALPMRDAGYDAVFAWGVIIHIPKADLALAELARIIKPGGSLALYVDNMTSMDNRLEQAVRFVLRRPLDIRDRKLGHGIQYDRDGNPLWLWRFDVSQIERVLEQHGLTLVARRAGELSELQRRTGGLLRRLLLRANNLAYKARVPALVAQGNVLVFRKEK